MDNYWQLHEKYLQEFGCSTVTVIWKSIDPNLLSCFNTFDPNLLHQISQEIWIVIGSIISVSSCFGFCRGLHSRIVAYMKGKTSPVVPFWLFICWKSSLFHWVYCTPTFKSVILFSCKHVRKDYDSVKIFTFPNLFMVDFLLSRAVSGKGKQNPINIFK